MSFKYSVEFDIDNFLVWSGAYEVMREVEEQGRKEEAQQIIEDYFDCCEIENVSDTSINDFVWFELADIMDLYKENEDTSES